MKAEQGEVQADSMRKWSTEPASSGYYRSENGQKEQIRLCAAGKHVLWRPEMEARRELEGARRAEGRESTGHGKAFSASDYNGEPWRAWREVVPHASLHLKVLRARRLVQGAGSGQDQKQSASRDTGHSASESPDRRWSWL